MTSPVATSLYTSEKLERILKTVNALESTIQETLGSASWLLIENLHHYRVGARHGQLTSFVVKSRFCCL